MSEESKWIVHCHEVVETSEWVYARDEEEAKQVIIDNWTGLIPLYAVKIEPEEQYYMGYKIS